MTICNWLLVAAWGFYPDVVLCGPSVGYAILFWVSWWVAATCGFSFAKIR